MVRLVPSQHQLRTVARDNSDTGTSSARIRLRGEDFVFAPKLRQRLHRVTVPVLVAWGEEDGALSAGYGRSYAAAFPDGHYTGIAAAGHFPHIEQPGAVLSAIGDFVDTVVKPDGD
jgi:pimeloyl-ACP methyl ester carboxylesterase